MPSASQNAEHVIAIFARKNDQAAMQRATNWLAAIGDELDSVHPETGWREIAVEAWHVFMNFTHGSSEFAGAAAVTRELARISDAIYVSRN